MVQFIMSKNTVQLGRPQVTLWRMRTAWWISNAKVTHSEYVIIMDFPLQQWVNESASMVGSDVHCLSCHRMPKTLCACVYIYIYIYKKNK